MQVTFLGTGSAGGVPLYGCQCEACSGAGADQTLVREPCSALIEAGGTRVLVDAGLMDLHRRFAPGTLNAIVLTHFHPDHVQGLFHLRWGKGDRIPVYIPPDPDGCADLFRHSGILDFRPQVAFSCFEAGNLRVTPLPLIHSKITFGYAFEHENGARFAYLTDTRGLPPETLSFLQTFRPQGLAIDCTFPPSDRPAGHNDWNLALECIDRASPDRAWLTHIGHDLDAWRLRASPRLPGHVQVACDGLRAELTPAIARPHV